MSRAGKIEVRVGFGGYPVWCELIYNGKPLVMISHRELSDLHYVAEKAMQEARIELKKIGMEEEV